MARELLLTNLTAPWKIPIYRVLSLFDLTWTHLQDISGTRLASRTHKNFTTQE